jgi:SAM-dependent methyltransferase
VTEGVRSTWGRYAPRFASEEADETKRPSIRALVELTALPAGSLVVDVATGAGFTAFAFAAAGCRVIPLDPTHEMLLATREGWASRFDLAPPAVVEAWAEALPFHDGSVDAVVSHRAPHQFADRSAFAAEARRVLRAGGVLAIGDQSPVDGFETWHNDLERLRDPTHERALSPREWRELVTRAGLAVERVEVVYQRHDVDDWLDRVDAPASSRARVIAELESIPDAIRDVYRPERSDGRLTMRTPQCVLIARR